MLSSWNIHALFFCSRSIPGKMKITLVLLSAAVCFNIAGGDILNVKLDPELPKTSSLSGASLQAHTNQWRLQPRQTGCTAQETNDLLSAIPEDCIRDLNTITGGFLINIFFNNDLFQLNPATLTAAFNVVCQPRCGNPIVRLYRDCGNPPQAAETFRYLCSTNAGWITVFWTIWSPSPKCKSKFIQLFNIKHFVFLFPAQMHLQPSAVILAAVWTF